MKQDSVLRLSNPLDLVHFFFAKRDTLRHHLSFSAVIVPEGGRGHTISTVVISHCMCVCVCGRVVFGINRMYPQLAVVAILCCGCGSVLLVCLPLILRRGVASGVRTIGSAV